MYRIERETQTDRKRIKNLPKEWESSLDRTTLQNPSLLFTGLEVSGQKQERERERERECVCVREREGERETEREKEKESNDYL